MSSGTSFKTSDWQWFLQDIDAQLELQMHPDQNEIERHQVEQRSLKGDAARQGSSPTHGTTGNSKDRLVDKKRTGYGTFFDVAKTGTVNGGDAEDEEMPILASSVVKRTSKAR
jgi:hypothetical protein